MWAYQTEMNSTCPNINAELLLLSRWEYTMMIVLSSLVVVVKMYDAISTKTCLIWKEH
jgi:hypothetical protein